MNLRGYKTITRRQEMMQQQQQGRSEHFTRCIMVFRQGLVETQENMKKQHKQDSKGLNQKLKKKCKQA